MQTLEIDIPEFLSIEQYAKMAKVNSSNKFDSLIQAVHILTGHKIEDIRTWSLDSIKDLADAFNNIADPKQEFHSIIEWNGELLGYSPVAKATLGEFIDIENLSKDLEGNMHKICAILYRPIVNHRFESFKFMVKQKIKMARNEVENVFDWYDTETYDSKKRKMREEAFKDFPVHIFLGAVAFFLNSVNMYSISILSSNKQISKMKASKLLQSQMELVSKNIGRGGGLFTHSLSPQYLALQATDQ